MPRDSNDLPADLVDCILESVQGIENADGDRWERRFGSLGRPESRERILSSSLGRGDSHDYEGRLGAFGPPPKEEVSHRTDGERAR
jgi:hypothetical protein